MKRNGKDWWYENMKPAIEDMQRTVKTFKEIVEPVQSTLRLHQSAVADVVRAHEQLGVSNVAKEAMEKAREVQELLKRYGVK